MVHSTLSQGRADPQVFRVDTHVHLHPEWDLGLALNAAAGHLGPSGCGVLMLTEMPGVDRFAELRGQFGAWELAATPEACAVHARRDGGPDIFVIAGHQIVTEEGLEVLMLGSRRPCRPGASLHETLDAVISAGALAVLPWGVGKWTGKRGQVVADLVVRPPFDPAIFLADSGVRMHGTARPKLLSQAEAGGWRVLAGTDPLAFGQQVASVGRYGVELTGDISASAPFADLRARLVGLSRSPPTYGPLQGVAGFLGMQIAMQVRKRLR